MRAIKFHLLATLSLIVSVSARVQAIASPTTFQVPTDQPPRVNIRTPLEEGWRVQRRQNDAVTFVYPDPMSDSDVIAVASQFEPQSSNTEAAFMAEFRREQESSARRYLRVVSARYDQSNKRGYPCVRAFVVADAAARVGGKIQVGAPPVRVHASTLACRKAGATKHGLFAFFQYPAPERSPRFDAMAESFFSGVQFAK